MININDSLLTVPGFDKKTSNTALIGGEEVAWEGLLCRVLGYMYTDAGENQSEIEPLVFHQVQTIICWGKVLILS